MPLRFSCDCAGLGYNAAMNIDIESISKTLRGAINRDRLVESIVKLVGVPSRTGEAGKACDCLAEMLSSEGFKVERPTGGHPAAPAVVTRLDSGKPGKTLQFDGHLDTVHLPFVPPAVNDGLITGSGSSDMKGGTLAAVEALRVLRDTGLLPGGSVLFTAHDLHEAPWSDGSQLDQLIKDGFVGDAALIPEPCHDKLSAVGKGSMTWKATIRRQGPPVHEVMRPMDEPSVIAAGAELVRRLTQLADSLAKRADPKAGCETAFIGQIHSGEIFNQYPQECWLEGTRRWLTGTKWEDVAAEFNRLLDDVARDTGTTIERRLFKIRDSFWLDQADPIVTIFQDSMEQTSGRRLPITAKPFVDDGSSFWALARIPAITHGPRAGGQHTTSEWVDIDDLVRVAHLYALTAVRYCGAGA